MPPFLSLRLSCLCVTTLLVAGCTSQRPEAVPSPPATVQQDATGTAEDGEEEVADEVITICVVKRTRVRSTYRPCDDARDGHAWYFIPLAAKVPAVGKKAKGGTFKDPKIEGYRASRRGGPGSEVSIYDDEPRVRVCVKKSTRVRFANARCTEGDKGFDWYFIPMDGYAPAIGKIAMDGSFRFSGGDNFSARTKGGDAVDAAIGYEPDDEPVDDTEEDTEDDTGFDSSTDTGSCSMTINGSCPDSDHTTSDFDCRSVFVNKRWTRRC